MNRELARLQLEARRFVLQPDWERAEADDRRRRAASEEFASFLRSR